MLNQKPNDTSSFVLGNLDVGCNLSLIIGPKLRVCQINQIAANTGLKPTTNPMMTQTNSMYGVVKPNLIKHCFPTITTLGKDC